MYSVDVSPDLISSLTDAVISEASQQLEISVKVQRASNTRIRTSPAQDLHLPLLGDSRRRR